MEMSVDQFEEAKKANEKWKYSNERTSESWRKVEANCCGIKRAKDVVESWERRCNASTCSFRLACLFISNPTSFSPTYQMKSFRRIRHKRKSSCHFAWRNGSIAAWMFVHPAICMGYWPSVRSRWLDIGQVLFLRGQYPAILTEQTWSIKDLLYGFWWNVACGIQRVVPGGQDGYILPARVANQSARFGSFCPLAELAI